MLDHRSLSQDRPLPVAPKVLVTVGLSIVVVMILTATLVFATGGSASMLLIGAITGAALGIVGGRVTLSMLRAKASQP